MRGLCVEALDSYGWILQPRDLPPALIFRNIGSDLGYLSNRFLVLSRSIQGVS
jgi:hypothetical protein